MSRRITTRLEGISGSSSSNRDCGGPQCVKKVGLPLCFALFPFPSTINTTLSSLSYLSYTGRGPNPLFLLPFPPQAEYQQFENPSNGSFEDSWGAILMAEISVALPSIWASKSRFDVWNSIQMERQSAYVHPLIRRSSSLMTQKSLEICTEGLGSETGSDGFSSADEFDFLSSPPASPQEAAAEDAGEPEAGEPESVEGTKGRRELPAVNYHCSIGRRWPPKSFPPPLPSISRRDGTCIKIRTLRRDGRLLVEAVPAPSQTYLHAERHDGRLLLSFINSPPSSPPPAPPISRTEEMADAYERDDYDDDDEYEEEEEEVEVVDRGSIVEVKVSGLAAVSRVHRSSLVINKFVVGSPLTAADVKVSASTTTAAAAAVAASSISAPASTSEGFHYNYLHHHQDTPWGPQSPAAAAAADAKLLFASKRLRREELLHDMRRCSELRRPLFIFEQPHCIATSS